MLSKTIFLSYARVDRARVEPIAHSLQSAGFSVWWDALLVGGSAFSSEIEAAIDRADAAVVLWSNASIKSDWVRDEAGHARDTGKLVPVLIDDCLPPLGFRQYHAVDLRSWRGTPSEHGFVALVGAIDGSAPVPVGAPRKTGPAPRATRRALIAGGGVALGATALAGIAWQSGLLTGSAQGNSVAVLPFENISGDPAQSYFSQGLAEEVRSTLSRDARLRVMAPTSIAELTAQGLTPMQLAARLNVASILSGSVRRGGELIRVTANLISGRDGFTIWSQSFDRGLTDVLKVESEIAATVLDALAERIGKKSGATPRVAGSVDTRAYDAYLRGRDLYGRAADVTAAKATLALFDQAIAADPDFAAAHAARARTLYMIGVQFGTPATLRMTYDDALVSARRAVTLAPEMPEVQSTLAYILFQGLLRVAEARPHYERSQITGAGDASILGRYAIYAAATGKAAVAREAMARAVTIDPLNPVIHRVAGYVAYARRDWRGAIGALAKAIELNSKLLDARAWTGDAQLALGDPAAARASYLAEPHELLRFAGLAIVERKLGNDAAARTALARLTEQFGDSSTYQQAQIQAQWGNTAEAVAKLEHAVSVPDVGLIYARNDPMLDPVRGEPQFKALLKSLGFV